jgi:hypothetical protein
MYIILVRFELWSRTEVGCHFVATMTGVAMGSGTAVAKHAAGGQCDEYHWVLVPMLVA